MQLSTARYLRSSLCDLLCIIKNSLPHDNLNCLTGAEVFPLFVEHPSLCREARNSAQFPPEKNLSLFSEFEEFGSSGQVKGVNPNENRPVRSLIVLILIAIQF